MPLSERVSGFKDWAAESTLGTGLEELTWEFEFAATTSNWLGISSEMAGGESTGRPGVDDAPEEAVVTWMESVAVVDSNDGGLLPNGCLSSVLLIDVGELRGPSSADFRGGR